MVKVVAGMVFLLGGGCGHVCVVGDDEDGGGSGGSNGDGETRVVTCIVGDEGDDGGSGDNDGDGGGGGFGIFLEVVAMVWCGHVCVVSDTRDGDGYGGDDGIEDEDGGGGRFGIFLLDGGCGVVMSVLLATMEMGVDLVAWVGDGFGGDEGVEMVAVPMAVVPVVRDPLFGVCDQLFGSL
ncbi:uncharacterized protein LOC111411528 [Olea europaea var. sylvestris]|uniref:uncharacterized protein LOC111411528 n=1 Tax=Olea europaea var. sylvestris TaxID=158386 RepID=UPI000C1D85B7|nr:uncharacterized protein LOC111411528 [Olea europaea var. sylvestris]